MGKNVKGGKKHKRGKKFNTETEVKNLVLKSNGQVYGKVLKLLGNCRIQARCYFDGGPRNLLCIIPGKFRKRVFINIDDIILVGIREFQSDKADVMYKYSSAEAKKLFSSEEIPASAQSGKYGEENAEDECAFDFFSTGDGNTNKIEDVLYGDEEIDLEDL